MTEEKYSKGNLIIALYMGATIVGSFNNNIGTADKPILEHDHNLLDMGKNRTMNECYWGDNTLKYHKDWNWLIPVYTKINKDIPFDHDDSYLIFEVFNLKLINTPIDVAWNYCVLYIEWLNKQRNS